MVEKIKKKTEIKILRNNKWQIKDNLALKEVKMYIPKNESLRLEIICVRVVNNGLYFIFLSSFYFYFIFVSLLFRVRV